VGRGHPDHRPISPAEQEASSHGALLHAGGICRVEALWLEIGFKWVEAAPLVRSSYHAAEQVRALSIVHRKLYGGG